jgi:hypothetical protein
MSRATESERAQRVNSAFNLLARGYSLSEAAQVLTESFALSRRQAYRYLQDAQALARPLRVAEPTIAVTIKVPGDVVGELRAYARTSGRTMGEIVARAGGVSGKSAPAWLIGAAELMTCAWIMCLTACWPASLSRSMKSSFRISVPPAVDWTLSCSSCGLLDGMRLPGFKG